MSWKHGAAGKRCTSIGISIAEIIPYDATPVPCRTSKRQVQHLWSSSLHLIQNACIVSMAIELDICTHYTPNATQPSLSFSPRMSEPFIHPGGIPFCGRQVSFDHHNRFAFCRIVVFPDVSIFDDSGEDT